jgi:hypothetical protein
MGGGEVKHHQNTLEIAVAGALYVAATVFGLLLAAFCWFADWVVRLWKRTGFIGVVVILAACSPQREVVTNEQGTFELIRPRGQPNELGAYNIALWAKRGVPTNQFIYMRIQHPDGSSHFISMLP